MIAYTIRTEPETMFFEASSSDPHTEHISLKAVLSRKCKAYG